MRMLLQCSPALIHWTTTYKSWLLNKSLMTETTFFSNLFMFFFIHSCTVVPLFYLKLFFRYDLKIVCVWKCALVWCNRISLHNTTYIILSYTFSQMVDFNQIPELPIYLSNTLCYLNIKINFLSFMWCL